MGARCNFLTLQSMILMQMILNVLALILFKFPGFPLGLENLEKWEGIFQSGNFEQTGKVREKSGKITQNTGKLREFQTNIIFYFLVIFKLTVYYFVEMHQIFSYKINF